LGKYNKIVQNAASYIDILTKCLERNLPLLFCEISNLVASTSDHDLYISAHATRCDIAY